MTMTLLDRQPAPVRDDATRRDFLAGLSASVLLAACGSQRSGSDGVTAGGTRSVSHPRGTVEVPERAARVVTLSEAVDGHLASVGLAPVGAAEGVADWLAPYRALLDPDLDLGAIEEIGSTEEPNIEAIARLGPDLIVTEVFFEDFYDTLSAIAPTVLVDRPNNGAWRSAFDQAIIAVGREAEAKAVRDRYQEAVTEAARRAGGMEVSFIRAGDDGSFRVDGGPGGFAGSVAVDAGLAVTRVPEGVGEVDESFTTVSGERLDVLTGGLIVAAAYAGQDATVDVLSRNPLWPALPAVTAGKVLSIPGEIYNGGTYVAAQLLLEAIAEALA